VSYQPLCSHIPKGFGENAHRLSDRETKGRKGKGLGKVVQGERDGERSDVEEEFLLTLKKVWIFYLSFS